MPNPGDQHRENRNTSNPFAEDKQSISSYTAREIATLSAKLDKQLGPEYISTRPGAGGGKVHYLAAEKVIQLANEIFGFNGWSSQIVNVQVDFVDENPTNGKVSLGLSTVVRVTLKDGTFHEDIGYGHIENCKGKAPAFEKAKKEATTDALKRALRNFGNVLGNCLYDKDYLGRVSKLKLPPSRWDSERLHRHPDYAPPKQEPSDAVLQNKEAAATDSHTTATASFGSVEFDEDFGGVAFDESDFTHADEVTTDDPATTRTDFADVTNVRHMPAPANLLPRIPSAPHLRGPNGIPRAPSPAAKLMIPGRPPMNSHLSASRLQQTPQRGLPPQNITDGLHSNHSSGSTAIESPIQVPLARSIHQAPDAPTEGHDQVFPGAPLPMDPPIGIPQGFVSGRSAVMDTPSETRPPSSSIAFNPHAESPSIRRTTGIHQGKSAPVSRKQLVGLGGTVPPSANTTNPILGPTTIRTDFVNPSADVSRRVGMPTAPGAMGNRGQYRPPTAIGIKRPPLTDLTNHQAPEESAEAKKQKTEVNISAAEQTSVMQA